MNSTTNFKNLLVAALALLLCAACTEQDNTEGGADDLFPHNTPAADSLGDWALGASFPGEPRSQAVAFVIDDYAYVGLGYRCEFIAPDIYRRQQFFYDFWEYDPSLTTEINGRSYEGSWRRMADFPHEDPSTHDGGGRRDAVAFSFSDSEDRHGYVGLGRGHLDKAYNDFYSFSPEGHSQNDSGQSLPGKWRLIIDDHGSVYPGNPRYGATAFVIDGNAYICLGKESAHTYSVENIKFIPDGKGGGSFYHMQATCEKPDNAQDSLYDLIPRAHAVSFTSQTPNDERAYAYIALGDQDRSTWRYDHLTDLWHRVEDISLRAGATPWVGAVAFSAPDHTGNNTFGLCTTGTTEIDSDKGTLETWWFYPGIPEWRGNDYTATPIGQIRYGN